MLLARCLGARRSENPHATLEIAARGVAQRGAAEAGLEVHMGQGEHLVREGVASGLELLGVSQRGDRGARVMP